MKPKQKMEVFDCLVSLGNNENDVVTLTVPKSKITATEVRILRAIHGAGAIKKQEKAGEIEMDERELQMRLARNYGVERVRKILGVELEDFDNWVAESEEMEQMERDQASEQRRMADRKRASDELRASLNPQSA